MTEALFPADFGDRAEAARERALAALAEVEGLVITAPEEYERASTTRAALRAEKEERTKDLLSVLKALHGVWRGGRTKVTAIEQPYQRADTILGHAMDDWVQRERERERAELEAAERAAQAEARARLEAEAEAAAAVGDEDKFERVAERLDSPAPVQAPEIVARKMDAVAPVRAQAEEYYTRTTYEPEVYDIVKLCHAVGNDPKLSKFVGPNMTEIRALTRSLGDNVGRILPGVRAKEKITHARKPGR
jgi:hypothetical protein